MTILARMVAVFGLIVLTACSGGADSSPATGAAAGWKITGDSVRFGPEISGTETGTDYNSTFVWDGYRGGNRKRQVVGLFRAAIGDVAATMSGGQPVKLNVVVTRFHAMTGQAQAWCCGEHNIVASLEVVDAASGSVLAAQEGVYLGRVALGGIPGLVAQAAGRDQAVRVREGIARGISRWLAGL